MYYIRCTYCNKKIYNKRHVTKHINIYNEPQEHLFCSKECKHKWCVGIKNGMLRVEKNKITTTAIKNIN